MSESDHESSFDIHFDMSCLVDEGDDYYVGSADSNITTTRGQTNSEDECNISMVDEDRTPNARSHCDPLGLPYAPQQRPMAFVTHTRQQATHCNQNNKKNNDDDDDDIEDLEMTESTIETSTNSSNTSDNGENIQGTETVVDTTTAGTAATAVFLDFMHDRTSKYDGNESTSIWKSYVGHSYMCSVVSQTRHDMAMPQPELLVPDWDVGTPYGNASPIHTSNSNHSNTTKKRNGMTDQFENFPENGVCLKDKGAKGITRSYRHRRDILLQEKGCRRTKRREEFTDEWIQDKIIDYLLQSLKLERIRFFELINGELLERTSDDKIFEAIRSDIVNNKVNYRDSHETKSKRALENKSKASRKKATLKIPAKRLSDLFESIRIELDTVGIDPGKKIIYEGIMGKVQNAALRNIVNEGDQELYCWCEKTFLSFFKPGMSPKDKNHRSKWPSLTSSMKSMRSLLRQKNAGHSCKMMILEGIVDDIGYAGVDGHLTNETKEDLHFWVEKTWAFFFETGMDTQRKSPFNLNTDQNDGSGSNGSSPDPSTSRKDTTNFDGSPPDSGSHNDYGSHYSPSSHNSNEPKGNSHRTNEPEQDAYDDDISTDDNDVSTDHDVTGESEYTDSSDDDDYDSDAGDFPETNNRPNERGSLDENSVLDSPSEHFVAVQDTSCTDTGIVLPMKNLDIDKTIALDLHANNLSPLQHRPTQIAPVLSTTRPTDSFGAYRVTKVCSPGTNQYKGRVYERGRSEADFLFKIPEQSTDTSTNRDHSKPNRCVHVTSLIDTIPIDRNQNTIDETVPVSTIYLYHTLNVAQLTISSTTSTIFRADDEIESVDDARSLVDSACQVETPFLKISKEEIEDFIADDNDSMETKEPILSHQALHIQAELEELQPELLVDEKLAARYDKKGEQLRNKYDYSPYVRRFIPLPGHDPRLRTASLSFVSAKNILAEYKFGTTNQISLFTNADIAIRQDLPLEEKHVKFLNICRHLAAIAGTSTTDTTNTISAVPENLTMSQSLLLIVRREHILSDSLHAILSLSIEDMRRPWEIAFTREVHTDQSSLTKEWLQCLTEQIFLPSTGLFVQSSNNQATVDINPASGTLVHCNCY